MLAYETTREQCWLDPRSFWNKMHTIFHKSTATRKAILENASSGKWFFCSRCFHCVDWCWNCMVLCFGYWWSNLFFWVFLVGFFQVLLLVQYHCTPEDWIKWLSTWSSASNSCNKIFREITLQDSNRITKTKDHSGDQVGVEQKITVQGMRLMFKFDDNFDWVTKKHIKKFGRNFVNKNRTLP